MIVIFAGQTLVAHQRRGYRLHVARNLWQDCWQDQRHLRRSLKLLPTSSGVNFINILRPAFTHVDIKSVKKIDNLAAIFTHLGSLRVKAA